MIALDTNVLVYAHRPEYSFHSAAGVLIRSLAEGAARWAIPWSCLHEFYAVVTNPRIHRTPSSPTLAWEQIEAWLESPTLSVLAEAAGHLSTVRDLSLAARTVGAQIHDARIAAVCLEHGVSELITMDRDFSRFPALRVRSLLA